MLALALQEAETVHSHYTETKTPFDLFLKAYFRRNNKRYGKRDRLIISDILFAHIRHRSFINSWIMFLENLPGDDNHFVSFFIGYVIEHSLDESTIQTVLTKRIIDKHVIEQISNALTQIKNKQLPPTCSHLEKNEQLSLQFSMPLFLVNKWCTTYGESSAARMCESLNKRAPLTIRTNLTSISRDDLMAILENDGYFVKPCTESLAGIITESNKSLYNTNAFQKGYFEVQDEGSQLVGYLINPKAENRIWDTCAGGGGKTLHLSDLTNNKAAILSTDISSIRLAELSTRLKRYPQHNITTAPIEKDGSTSHILSNYDLVFIDAPCSGTGRLRRNPELKWTISAHSIAEHAKENVSLMLTYADYVKKGGVLYYVTCSLENEENNAVIENFLSQRSDFTAGIFLPHNDIHITSNQHYVTLNPADFGTDVFFIAVLKRLS